MAHTNHKTILVVEDDASGRQCVAQILEDAGYTVFIAKDGNEAFQQVLQSRGIDLLFADVMLPGINGMDLARVIERQQPRTRIILCSGNLDGMDDQPDGLAQRIRFLQKPFSAEILRTTVREVLAGDDQQDPQEEVTSTAAAPGPDILVVDDEPMISRLLKEFLARLKFSARFAATGTEALASVHKRLPDLMILDIYMPGMNGVELLRRLHTRWPDALPFGVIILTGSRDEPLLQETLTLGAFDVLLKPVSLEYLDLAIWTQLALKPLPSIAT